MRDIMNYFQFLNMQYVIAIHSQVFVAEQSALVRFIMHFIITQIRICPGELLLQLVKNTNNLKSCKLYPVALF